MEKARRRNGYWKLRWRRQEEEEGTVTGRIEGRKNLEDEKWINQERTSRLVNKTNQWGKTLKRWGREKKRGKGRDKNVECIPPKKTRNHKEKEKLCEEEWDLPIEDWPKEISGVLPREDGMCICACSVYQYPALYMHHLSPGKEAWENY